MKAIATVFKQPCYIGTQQNTTTMTTTIVHTYGQCGHCTVVVVIMEQLTTSKYRHCLIQCFASWLSMCKVEMALINISTVDFQLVVQKSRRESAHARTWAGILNRKFCACVNSRRNFWTTNWKSTVVVISIVAMNVNYYNVYSVIRIQLCTWTTNLQSTVLPSLNCSKLT